MLQGFDHKLKLRMEVNIWREKVKERKQGKREKSRGSKCLQFIDGKCMHKDEEGVMLLVILSLDSFT